MGVPPAAPLPLKENKNKLKQIIYFCYDLLLSLQKLLFQLQQKLIEQMLFAFIFILKANKQSKDLRIKLAIDACRIKRPVKIGWAFSGGYSLTGVCLWVVVLGNTDQMRYGLIYTG